MVGGGPPAQAELWGPPPGLHSPPPTGYTPLHVAVLRRDLELVQLLLRAGADPDRPVGAPKIPPKKTQKWDWGGSWPSPDPTVPPRSRAVAAAPCTWPWRPRAPRWPSVSCRGGRSRIPARSRGSPPCTARGAAPTPACPPFCAASGPATLPPATAATAATASAGPRTARSVSDPTPPLPVPKVPPV